MRLWEVRSGFTSTSPLFLHYFRTSAPQRLLPGVYSCSQNITKLMSYGQCKLPMTERIDGNAEQCYYCCLHSFNGRKRTKQPFTGPTSVRSPDKRWMPSRVANHLPKSHRQHSTSQPYFFPFLPSSIITSTGIPDNGCGETHSQSGNPRQCPDFESTSLTQSISRTFDKMARIAVRHAIHPRRGVQYL